MLTWPNRGSLYHVALGPITIHFSHSNHESLSNTKRKELSVRSVVREREERVDTSRAQSHKTKRPCSFACIRHRPTRQKMQPRDKPPYNNLGPLFLATSGPHSSSISMIPNLSVILLEMFLYPSRLAFFHSSLPRVSHSCSLSSHHDIASPLKNNV
jgi:hypothetical protein